MARFGTYLLERGALTRAQLEEATQSQVVFGGRLGTNLVELGYLRLDALEAYLSGHLGVPTAPPAWIDAPYQDALDAVPAELARRQGVLPLVLEKRTLHVAMLDPTHPERIDDVAFATGLRIRPYALSELRLTAMLEQHYGIPRDTRYISLGPELARGRTAPRGPAAEPRGEAAAAETAPPDLIDEATFSALTADWNAPLPDAAGESATRPERAPEPRPMPAVKPTAAEFERQLARAADRDDVGRLALDWATLYCDAAALFVVRGGMIAGFLGDGVAISERLDGILVPADTETLLASAAREGRIVRCAPLRAGLDARVYAALGRAGARESLVIPVAVRDRVINVLYADTTTAPFGETDAAALGALCGCVAEAYERLVLERKRIAGIGVSTPRV